MYRVGGERAELKIGLCSVVVVVVANIGPGVPGQPCDGGRGFDVI
jgi:hypothetical protein